MYDVETQTPLQNGLGCTDCLFLEPLVVIHLVCLTSARKDACLEPLSLLQRACLVARELPLPPKPLTHKPDSYDPTLDPLPQTPRP